MCNMLFYGFADREILFGLLPEMEENYELLKKLQVLPSQKLSTMSCGQRSRVALGLLFAQDPELLILDDFSMGLDPGYRRLFCGIPSGICVGREQDSLSHFAHHSGHGIADR